MVDAGGAEAELFFAQLEAALTVIFLKEGRTDFLQGIAFRETSQAKSKQTDGYAGFQRYACKMATGDG